MSKSTSLALEEALARLPEGERIHTFTQNLMGADWDRASLVAEMRAAESIEWSGPLATASGHGIYLRRRDGRVLFIQTREEVL